MNLDHFDELLDAYLLGELSEEQSAQLQQAMATDPAARRRFVQSILIEAQLHRLARSEPVSLTPRAQHPSVTASLRQRTLGRIGHPRRLALVAAVVIAAIGIALFYFARQDSSPPARLISGAVMVDGQSRDRIAEGSTLDVTSPAPAVIDLPDGSRATLDPATQLTLRGRVDNTRQVLHLASGGGQFQVTHGGGQFRIDTPAGSVTVLGTQFTAVLRSPRNLFVSVQAGSVRFDRQDQSVTLNTGQSRTFGPEPDRPATSVAATIETGYIHSVDIKTRSFVLGGRNESQTTFRVGEKAGEWEAAIFLDGRKAAFQTAIQPGRKATVIWAKIGVDLWVTKMEVTSATKEP